MPRPDVSVVIPFVGSRSEAEAALDVLRALDTQPGDELILADNAGTAPAGGDIIVVRAGGERSPARARNAGAELASSDWILFIDADCRAPRTLLDDYFREPVDPEVGALAGEVVPAPDPLTLAGRYASARNFLGQRAHVAHSYRPRAVAANLLVRASAFEQVGGFYEGLRAAEDTDFCWRVQAAGWRLELRPAARVEHSYRASIGELRRQWRGYAAGRAWLARRYEGFEPEPALLRAVGRLPAFARPRSQAARLRSSGRSSGGSSDSPSVRGPSPGRLERARYAMLDALLGVDELAGFALSNRPERIAAERAHVVLVVGGFPIPDDPLVQFARTLAGARVEAAARPESPDHAAVRELQVDYREDDGIAARALASVRLAVRHPIRSLRDMAADRAAGPSLTALAPAALRLERDPDARVVGLGGEGAHVTARRLARLAGHHLDVPPAQ